MRDSDKKKATGRFISSEMKPEDDSIIRILPGLPLAPKEEVIENISPVCNTI
jgi:hypothetical protein